MNDVAGTFGYRMEMISSESWVSKQSSISMSIGKNVLVQYPITVMSICKHTGAIASFFDLFLLCQ